MSNHDFVSNLPPRDTSGIGRDELFGNAAGTIESTDANVTDIYECVPPLTNPYGRGTVVSHPQMAGICRTCGRTISAQRFFEVGKCYGC